MKAPNIPNKFILIITMTITPSGCNFNLLPIIFGVIKFPSNCCTIKAVKAIFRTNPKSMVRATRIAGSTPKKGPTNGITEVIRENTP